MLAGSSCLRFNPRFASLGYNFVVASKQPTCSRVVSCVADQTLSESFGRLWLLLRSCLRQHLQSSSRGAMSSFHELAALMTLHPRKHRRAKGRHVQPFRLRDQVLQLGKLQSTVSVSGLTPHTDGR